MSETSKPYLNVNFGEAGGKFSWESHEEVIQWINAQISEWSWLSQLNLSTTNNAVSAITQGHLAPARDALNQALQYPGNPDQIQRCITAAKSHLESSFAKNEWLLPNSTLRKYIFTMRDSGKEREAGLITAYLLNTNLSDAPLGEVISVVIEVELFKRGHKDRLKIENIALKSLTGQMTTSLTEHKELQIKQNNQFSEFNNDLTKQAGDQSKAFNDSQQERTTEWENTLNKTQADLDKLTATYDEHMSLEAPVTYWENKRVKHKWMAICTFSVLVLCMYFFGKELVDQLTGNNPYIILNKAGVQKTAEIGGTSPLLDFLMQSKIGAYILIVTLIFWFIRLLVRLFLSNLHLENDAAERVTMAKTYLSLIRDGAFERKEHLGTILAALFRPTGDGIVKDEGLPPTAMEWLTKLSGKN